MSSIVRSCVVLGVCHVIGSTAIADVRQATVKIVGSSSFVTATVIHASKEHGTFAITCRHGIGENENWQWQVGGQSYPGRWRVVSNDSDLALLWDGRSDLAGAVAPLASGNLTSGDQGLSLGYDQPLSGGGYSRYGGRHVNWWTAKLTKVGFVARQDDGSVKWMESVIASHQAGPGRSGGGLFNRQGELLGVCSQARGYGATFVGHTTIVDFLNRCHDRGYIRWWNPVEPDISYATEQIVEYFIGQAEAAQVDGKPGEAIKHYTAAIEQDAELAGFRAYFGRGVLQRTLGNVELAWADLQQAATLNPKHADCQIICGNVMYHQGRFQAALAYYDAAVKLDAESAVAHFNRGGAQFALQKFDLAAADYRLAIAHSDGKERKYYESLADALARSGHPAASEQARAIWLAAE